MRNELIKQDMESFGKNLRRARVVRNVTQEHLAEQVSLNIRTLQRIEAGQTNILVTTAMRLMVALGCHADELLGNHRSREHGAAEP